MRNKHLSFRSGNPALNANTFASYASKGSQTMTIMGTVNKTALALLLLMTTALFTWNLPAGDPRASGLMGLGFIGGFVLAIVTAFKHSWARFTVPLYALLQGLALGGLAKIFESMYPGIVNQAVMLTFGTLGSLLLAYKSGLIKATENFKLGVFAATGGVVLLYIISFIMSFFGEGISLLSPQNSSMMSIGLSLAIIVIASLNLVIDFDFIEEGAEKGAPKYMEWYGAFGLLVTLIWLYLEILRMLAKFRNK